MSFARIARVLAAAALVLLFHEPVFSQGNELAQANRALKQGRLDSALEHVDAYLSGHPRDAGGRFLKGVILTHQKKSADAIRIFTDLTHDYPELAEPYNNLAVLYAAEGEYDKARTALEMAIRANPGYAAAHENLGDLYAKMAGQSYDRAMKLDRNDTSAQAKLKLINELLSKSGR